MIHRLGLSSRPSRASSLLAASISAAAMLAGCAGRAAATAPSAATAGQGMGAATPAPVRSPGPRPSSSRRLLVGVSDNRRTVELDSGETLVLTLPRSGDRELGGPMISSSNTAVLRPVAGPGQGGRPGALLVVYFRALRPGIAVIRATGTLPFRLLVRVLPA